MHDLRKKNRAFLVYMLQVWHVHESSDTGYCCDEVLEPSKDDLPVWGGRNAARSVKLKLQRDQVRINVLRYKAY